MSPEIIQLAVMMYIRFPLSLRNVEDLLPERGIDVWTCHAFVPTLSLILGAGSIGHRNTLVFKTGVKVMRQRIYSRDMGSVEPRRVDARDWSTVRPWAFIDPEDTDGNRWHSASCAQ